MENDDLDEYEGIFDDDEIIDTLIFDKIEKDLDKEKNLDKGKSSGCFAMILAISGCGLFGILLLILI